MKMNPPYSFIEAEGICKKYKYLIGNELILNNVLVGKSEDVITSPFESKAKSDFVKQISCHLNTAIVREVFHQHFETDVCDVLIVFCFDKEYVPVMGEYTAISLHEYIHQEKSSVLQ